VDADIATGGKGKLTAKGDITMAPMVANADILLADFELRRWSPTSSRNGRCTEQWTAFAQGALRMTDVAVKGEPRTKFAGELSIANLATKDTESNQTSSNGDC